MKRTRAPYEIPSTTTHHNLLPLGFGLEREWAELLHHHSQTDNSQNDLDIFPISSPSTQTHTETYTLLFAFTVESNGMLRSRQVNHHKERQIGKQNKFSLSGFFTLRHIQDSDDIIGELLISTNSAI